ncbi:MAG: ATP synthase F0 subunit B [Candidatus Binatia bacterium]
MISLDYTVFVQIASFLLLLYLLNRLVFTPFRLLLEERERRTEGVEAETESFLEEGKRLRAEYENKISRARGEGTAIKEAIRQEALEARGRILDQAQEEAARALERARGEIRGAVQKGREVVAEEAEVIAQQMAEKILGRKIG